MPFPMPTPRDTVVPLPRQPGGGSTRGAGARPQTPDQIAADARRRTQMQSREDALFERETQNQVQNRMRPMTPAAAPRPMTTARPSPSMDGIVRATAPQPMMPPTPYDQGPQTNPANPIGDMADREREDAQRREDIAREDARRNQERGWATEDANAADARERAMLTERARLNDETFNKRFGMLNSAGGEGGGGDATPAYDPAKAQAARDAAFAQAKDKQGQIARSSLDSIKNVLGERGFLGGGMEAGATADVVSNAADGVGEFNRDQLMSDLEFETGRDNRTFEAKERAKDRSSSYRNNLLGLVNATLY